jgi:hypothetical protein
LDTIPSGELAFEGSDEAIAEVSNNAVVSMSNKMKSRRIIFASFDSFAQRGRT